MLEMMKTGKRKLTVNEVSTNVLLSIEKSSGKSSLLISSSKYPESKVPEYRRNPIAVFQLTDSKPGNEYKFVGSKK